MTATMMMGADTARTDANMKARAEAEQREQAMTTQIEALTRATVDAMIETKGLQVVATNTLPDTATTNETTGPYDNVVMQAMTGQGVARLRLLSGAHEQLAEKLGIPRVFYDRLLRTQPDLIAHLATELMHREPSLRMLRMLRPMTEHDAKGLDDLGAQFAVRAIVSDKFRPLDHGGLLQVLLPEAQARGLLLREWQLSDKKFTARFTGVERTIEELRVQHGFKPTGDNYHVVDANGKDRAWVNEVLSSGAMVSNSETGHGALSVTPISRIAKCLNDYVVTQVLRVAHVGGRKKADDEFGSTEGADTRRLEASAQFARVRDRFIDAVSETTQKRVVDTIAKANGEVLQLPESVSLLTFVDNVGARFDLSEREREILADEVVHEQVESGRPLTRFTIGQGMTALARRVGSGEKDLSGGQDRRLELEQNGWRILEDPTVKLMEAAKAAAKKN